MMFETKCLTNKLLSLGAGLLMVSCISVSYTKKLTPQEIEDKKFKDKYWTSTDYADRSVVFTYSTPKELDSLSKQMFAGPIAQVRASIPKHRNATDGILTIEVANGTAVYTQQLYINRANEDRIVTRELISPERTLNISENEANVYARDRLFALLTDDAEENPEVIGEYLRKQLLTSLAKVILEFRIGTDSASVYVQKVYD